MGLSQTDLSDDIRDYTFELPPELIAQSPAVHREEARLLVVRRHPGVGLPRFEDLQIKDLPQLMQRDAALQTPIFVRNRSRVLKARFYAQRASGSRHEIVLLEETRSGHWSAIIRNQAKINFPETLQILGLEGITVQVTAPGEVDFGAQATQVVTLLEQIGEMPLPPYITNRDGKRDTERYQSIWADPARTLSSAAPTASLHFSPDLVLNMQKRGALFADLFLHVGLGTFEPLRQNLLSQHEIHSERIEVPGETVRILRQSLGREATRRPPIVCVGTTALRALESLSLWEEAPREGVTLQTQPDGSLKGETRLFVRPGFKFRYVDALLTNFHLPESTLFVLISTFLGSRHLAREVYAHAVAKKYRFFSYGDATLFI